MLRATLLMSGWAFGMCLSMLCQVGSKLAAVVSQWGNATFHISSAPVPAAKGRKVQIFHSNSTSELLSNLDESQIVLTTLLTNRHHHPFAQELVQWNRWLSVVRDVLGTSAVSHPVRGIWLRQSCYL